MKVKSLKNLKLGEVLSQQTERQSRINLIFTETAYRGTDAKSRVHIHSYIAYVSLYQKL